MFTTPRTPEQRRSRPVRRALALLAVLALLLPLAACARDEVGSGFRLHADQLAGTTTTTTAPRTTYVTETATARVPQVEVFAQRPAPDGTPPPPRPPAAEGADTRGGFHPIPREDLLSAGSAWTPTGWRFDNPTYFGNPLVFMVVERDEEWVKVKVPARPNGQTGWVRASDVEIGETRYRMELTLSEFTLRVFDGPEMITETLVVIGEDATYTPVGRFYLNESIPQDNPRGPFGPWVLSTNGYSESMEFFDGGLPVIAFHGTNQPQLMGTKASNGCIRMTNDVVTFLAETLPAGTPVDIKA